MAGHRQGFALAVVGQRAIDPARSLVDGQPFGAVHLGRAQQVAGLPGFDEHLALVGKTIGRCQWALAVHQRQPLALAIGVKTGHVQRALVQQMAVGFGPAGLHAASAHEFVDVFKAGVFA